MEAAAYLDLTNSESPQFIGRVISALASDPDILTKSGDVLVAAAEAAHYGIADVDGRQPAPLTLAQV
jgi:dehydrogenase/reductase SDR family member 1